MHLRSEGQEEPAACALRAGPRVPGKVAVAGGGGLHPAGHGGGDGPVLSRKRDGRKSGL